VGVLQLLPSATWRATGGFQACVVLATFNLCMYYYVITLYPTMTEIKQPFLVDVVRDK